MRVTINCRKRLRKGIYVLVCISPSDMLSPDSDKGHRHSASMYSPRHSSARDLADAELQRAIELSLEEVGAVHGRRPGYVPAQPSAHNWHISEPPLVDRMTHPDRKVANTDEGDPDLRAAIEASLREANAPKPSAPVELTSTDPYSNVYVTSQSYPPTVTPAPQVPKLAGYDLEPLETDAILTFSQTVEQLQAQGGRDMSRYPAVNELYDKANGLRPKLAMSLDDTDRKERGSVYLEIFHSTDTCTQNCYRRCTKSFRKLSNSTISY